MANELMYKVAPVLQANSKCCWLACYQMLYDWKGELVSEATRKITEAKISITTGLDSSDWIKARIALGLTGYRVSYLKTFDDFFKVFSDHGPMWCGGSFLDGDPHAILIVGVHPDNKRIRYLDPYKLWKNGGEGYEYMTHDKWCGLIRNETGATQMWWDTSKKSS